MLEKITSIFEQFTQSDTAGGTGDDFAYNIPSRKEMSDVYTKRAQKYELTHHMTTWFRDTVWRQEVAWLAQIPDEDALVLDLCTGVAMSPIEYCRVWDHQGKRDYRIVGVDYTPAMLTVAHQKAEKAGVIDRLDLMQGDATNMRPGESTEGMAVFEDNTFDAVTCICGVGGIEEPNRAYEEMLRVLKPGGRVVLLDNHRPIEGLHNRARQRSVHYNTWILELILRRGWGWGDATPMLYDAPLAQVTQVQVNPKTKKKKEVRYGFETLSSVVRHEYYWLAIATFVGRKTEIK